MTPNDDYAEALRRIEAARERGARVLDLGDLCLEAIPGELSELTGLRVLALGKWAPKARQEGIEWKYKSDRTPQPFEDLSPPLASLASLSPLDLSLCGATVTHLSPLAGLASLFWLKLSDCGVVSDLSPLAGLTSLSWLDLRGCDSLASFTSLRPLLARLEKLFLYGASFPTLPSELTGDDHNENVLPAVRAYYADLDAGAVGDAELKVFLLGNGRVGKTQLARFLCERDYDPDVPSTHGVRLHDQPFDVPGLPHPVRLNLWDFGGQDIYHGSHALFLQGQAVFLLLWDPDLEKGEFTEAGLTIKNRPLAYWFDYLRTLAGSRRVDGRIVVESPVLLIQSRCESRRDERDPPCLPSRDEFPNLSTLTFSARTGRHKDSLTETLQEAIADLFGRRKQPLIGVGRVAVRERIRAAQAMPEGERIRTLTRDEFRRWCDETGGVSDADALLQFLHRTGVVFYRPGLFGDRVILDQAWALEAIYAVFHRRTDLQRELNLRRGRFTRELLDRFLWGAIRRDEGKEPYTPAEQELFLGMMTQCHIAFQVRDEDHGEAGREFAAPELLPEWTNWNDLHFRHLLRRPADDAVVLRYDFLHDGIARRFLAQVGARARQQAVYWKYGCGFYDARTETDVIVRCEPAPTADRPGAGAISLGTWGPGARELLLTLTEVLMRMPIGQPPRLEPADFLDRSAQQGMRSDAGNPMARVEPAVRPRTVFVSYAHGPVTSDLVRRLAARLGTAGTTVVWDAECLREGESISAFIDSVRTVPVLIAVFDSRYPRSAYCASELFAFYESCGSLPVAFAERVVPLVLGDARIDTDLDRKDHGIFWADEAARRSPAAATGSLDDHAYRTFQHMHTWARQIANRLADLTNRLSSLRGEGIAVDDFQNVVDRLEAVYLRLGM